MKHWFLFVVAVLLSGCVGIPQGVTPVKNFQVERYLGKWYEVVRLDNTFERNLEQVTAEYQLREDGTIRVINRGYNTVKQQWSQIEGRAKFVGATDVGRLKVSFFGPFYGGYNVVELDPNYRYALVVGNNRDYLWILSRTPQLDATVQQQLIAKAARLGFATDKFVVVKQ